MPNPFPGMDPYLEGSLWPTVHSNLIEEIARQLAPKVRPKYLALTAERVIVATPDPLELGNPAVRMPDVGVYKSSNGTSGSGASVVTAPLAIDALFPEAIEQAYVEIRDMEHRQLVTAIEVLSMTNKRGDGLHEFRTKRKEIVDAKCHYLEIDFLRLGERFPVARPLPSVPYFVFLSRANRRPKLDIWPIALDEVLPRVNVPLLNGDADVILDLQQALQTIYDIYGYDEAVHHDRPPAVPLSAEQMAWVTERLQSR